MSTVPVNSIKYFCFILNYRNPIQTHKFLSQHTSASVGGSKEKIKNTANGTVDIVVYVPTHTVDIVVYVPTHTHTHTHTQSMKFWLAILQKIYREILFISRYTLMQTNM